MIKLSPHILLLDVPQTLIHKCNCLLVEDGLTCLIETATTDEIYTRYLENKSIDYIINSHGHIDHTFRNAQITGARVLLHEADHPIVASMDPYFWILCSDQIGVEAVNKLIILEYQCRPANGSLSDGEVISCGQVKMEVMHLPGHTPGHCGFLFPNEGFVFSGDITMQPFGPWYANANSSINDFVTSIERLAHLQPDMIIPAHGDHPITKSIKSRLDRYRDIIFQREERIIELLFRGRHTIPDILAGQPIYKSYFDPKERVFEWVMVYNHLRRLEELGKVEKVGERYFLLDGIRPSNLHLG